MLGYQNKEKEMKAEKFINDLEAFLKDNPTNSELTEWLDTYSVTKVDLVRVIQYLVKQPN